MRIRLAAALAALTALTVTACGGGPGYSTHMARMCNAQMTQVNAENDQAMTGSAGDPSHLYAAVAMVKRMKREGCPDGPYPLKVPS